MNLSLPQSPTRTKTSAINTRPTSPILIRARSPSIYYRGEMTLSPIRKLNKRRVTQSLKLKPVNHEDTSIHTLSHKYNTNPSQPIRDLIKFDSPDKVGMVAQGNGEEWVLSQDQNSFRKWYSGDWNVNRLHGVGSILNEDNGTTVFRGHFNNGKREGFGKQFSSNKLNQHVMFRGNFHNDKKHGFGAVFYDNGRLHYEGELMNGFFHGKGTLYHPVTSHKKHALKIKSFEGYFKKNLKSGSGKEYDKYGNLLYEGNYLMNKRYGYGKAYHCSNNHQQGQLSFIGRFENRLKTIANGCSVPHGGAGCLYLLNGIQFISSNFNDGCVDKYLQSTMIFPDGKIIFGKFHQMSLTWISLTGIEPIGDDVVWRGNGEIIWPNGNRYVGEFRNGQPHGIHSGILTTNGLDQFQGRWKLGKCKPSISSREVVRKGLALIFKFDQYPSHINDPTGCENDTNLFHALMIKYQFDVWREDNLRSQSVYQTLLEAQLFLKTHPKMYDCLVVFSCGMGLRPGTVSCCDVHDFPNPDEFLNDEFIPSLKGVPKLFISNCSHAPRDTKGWKSNRTFEETTTTKNIVQINATRMGNNAWDEDDQGGSMVQCLCHEIEARCLASLKKSPITGMDLNELLECLRFKSDLLLPFEDIVCKRINPTNTKIQFVTATEIKKMDDDHLLTLIQANSQAIAQKVMLDVMRRV